MAYTPDIDGNTKTLGLIGEGIKHTLSPRIHNSSAKNLGINCVYLPFDLPGPKLDDFLKLHWELGSVGFNVTVPHKSQAASIFADSGLRSVNTIYRGNSGWQAASTDGEGFAKGLDQIGKSQADFDRIVLLGSGGVVKALGEYFRSSKQEFSEIHICRRSDSNDQELKEIFVEPCFHDLSSQNLAPLLKGFDESTLFVQCTSAPLRGDDLKEFLPALEGFGGALVDTVYGTPSSLYYRALAMDLTAQDGEAMLIEQARLSQMIWWGRCASYRDIASAIRGK